MNPTTASTSVAIISHPQAGDLRILNVAFDVGSDAMEVPVNRTMESGIAQSQNISMLGSRNFFHRPVQDGIQDLAAPSQHKISSKVAIPIAR